MERNIIRDLLILKQMNIKLNFSELARIYDMDNHTVVKYWLGGGIKKVERKPKKVFWIDRYVEDNIGTYNWKYDIKP